MHILPSNLCSKSNIRRLISKSRQFNLRDLSCTTHNGVPYVLGCYQHFTELSILDQSALYIVEVGGEIHHHSQHTALVEQFDKVTLKFRGHLLRSSRSVKNRIVALLPRCTSAARDHRTAFMS